METQHIPIQDLSVDPANARSHNSRNIEAIKSSLVKFGQQKPIVVNAKNEVIAGNGTLTAARDLGWEKLTVVYSDLSGSESMAYAIADNRTSELAVWDQEALAEQLSILQCDDSINEIVTGFTTKEIDDFINFTLPGVGVKELKENSFSVFEHICPKCGFEYDE